MYVSLPFGFVIFTSEEILSVAAFFFKPEYFSVFLRALALIVFAAFVMLNDTVLDPV